MPLAGPVVFERAAIPSVSVSTSHAEDYPRTIQQLAESLLAYAK